MINCPADSPDRGTPRTAPPRAATSRSGTPALQVRMDDTVRHVPLANEPVTIGRHPRSTIVIDHDTLSRRHCVLEPGPEGWRLRDLSSRNGTFVNGVRVTEHQLVHGDTVRAGGAIMRFTDGRDAPLIESHGRSGRSAAKASGSLGAHAPEQPSPKQATHPRIQPPASSAAQPAAPAPGLHDDELTKDEPISRKVPFDVRLTRDVLALEVAVRRLVETPADGPLDLSGLRLRVRATDAADEHDSPAQGVLRLVHLLLAAARRIRATDLHLDPKDDHSDVRWRVDGLMIDPIRVERAIHERIVRSVRTLCRLKEAGRADLVEGHFSASFKGDRVDYRASFAPTVHGTKLALRILDSHSAPQELDALGLHGWMSERLRDVSRRESGLVLACGPTGCGKTTTLHACLREIDAARRNVVTIEDPVEYEIERCTQLSVDTERGRDFAALLRSVLRQDPDVILVGEIRDLDTAVVAMQSAMTGHLVYSTVHARDTIQAIFRLLDLGVERSLVANAIDTILAQRLVRALCHDCRRAVRPGTSEARQMQIDAGTVSKIYIPVGCPACLRTGFRGRRAVFEMLSITDQIRDDILGQPSIHRMRSLAEQGLFTRLVDSGYRLVAQGVTSFDEVSRLEAST